MTEKRRTISVGNVDIGGNNEISIQSMTNTKTSDIKTTVAQILDLEKEGCEIIRVAVPDVDSANAIKEIKSKINIPIIADIHFDHRLALRSVENGADGLRLNPGNIKKKRYIKLVVNKAKEKNIPIRIGVNAGSIDRKKYEHPTPEALVDSALNHIKILEKMNYENIKVSLKSYDVNTTIKSYELFSNIRDYPLHVGITEAGDFFKGSIRSSIGIGILLYKGLCDTFRVSLTADPMKEVMVAKEILNSLNIRQFGIDIISCPTCGRTEIDISKIVQTVKERTRDIDANLKVAIMGCAVNGPGEARDADIGIAGGKKEGLLFEKGEIMGKYPEDKLIKLLIERIKKYEND